MRVLVTISRDYPDPAGAVAVLLREINSTPTRHTVVHGASQLDWLLAGAALAWGHQQEPHKYIDQLGKAGGPARNQEMVNRGADICLAFISPASRGARDCARRASRANIRTLRFGVPLNSHGLWHE